LRDLISDGRSGQQQDGSGCGQEHGVGKLHRLFLLKLSGM
jgi:hypothetical protein